MIKFTTRKATICVAVTLSAALVQATAAADDFFSSDSLNKVFNPNAPTETEPAPPQQVPPQQAPQQQIPVQPVPQSKALEPSEIPMFLTMLGYQPENLGDGVYKVTLKKDEWTLPYAFVISPNKSQFWVTLSLNSLKEGVSIPQDKLLGMLEFNHNYGPVHFAFSGKFRKIYICRALKNDGLNPTEVKQVIEVLANLAIKHEDLWNDAKWQMVQKPQAPPQRTQPRVQTQPAPRHVGTWRSTAADKSTFQLTLNADGTFVLYHTQPTKQDKSVGRYTLIGNQLTLIISETDRLESFVTWYTNGTWRFQVKNAQPGAPGLLFARI